jgi:hypothetical protein
VACRLVVRRVRSDCSRWPVTSTEQGELFATYRHHAFITNSTCGARSRPIERHRGHAVIEQVIAELKDGPLAHLPSGKYAANAAWVAHAVIAFNIARAAAVASRPCTRARWATLRTQSHQRARPHRRPPAGASMLHLPTHWPWAQRTGSRLWSTATGPPRHRHDLTTQPTTALPEDSKWKSRQQTGGPATPQPRVPPRTTPPKPSIPDPPSVDQGSADVGWWAGGALLLAAAVLILLRTFTARS